MRSRNSSANRSKQRIPWLWSVLLIVTGLVLLLDNFLLLGDFNAITLLPLVLVIAGAQILLRGDLVVSTESRRFGITRGSVESGTLEISSAEIDVDVRALHPDWRLRDGQHALIAGEYASGSRPQLDMVESHTHIKMMRWKTPILASVDWKVGVASDLPWQVLISTHIGQVNVDLANVIINDAVIATGFGDIRLVSPFEAFSDLHVYSTLGNIHIITPEGYNTQIIIPGSRLFRVNSDEERYENVEPGVYVARHADDDAPLVTVYVRGTFGDAYLA